MKVIVGSTAVVYHGIGFRKPKDIDIWISPDEDVVSGDCKVIPLDILELVPTVDGYATLDAIYTIKCSHLGWSNPLWNKHKRDILHFKSLDCVLLRDLYDALIKFWKQELGNKEFLNLNKQKDSFFTDYVTYTYDHDWLHTLVSYPDKPMYTNCLVDGEEVMIDRAKFSALPFEHQVRLFREEITAIALERWIFNPKIKKPISWYKGYLLSLEKTITQLTKNWATEFIVLNIEHFNKPEYAYFEYAIKTLQKEITHEPKL